MLMLVKFPDGRLSNELVYDQASYKEAEIIGPALIDSGSGRVELTAWLKIVDGRVVIDQGIKNQILAQENAAKQSEDAKTTAAQALNRLKNLPQITTIAQANNAIQDVLTHLGLK